MLVFYLMILGLAFVVVAVPALWDRLHRRQLCFGDLFVAFVILSAVSGICARLFLYFAGDGIYSFMDFGAKQQRQILLPALAADILTYTLIMLVRRAKEKRTALFEGKKHGIVPFVSLRYCFLALAGLYWVLCLADSVMPQYGYWRTENANINSKTEVHDSSEKYRRENSYPLVYGADRLEEGDKVILVMGDSFVWGDGSDNINKQWWRVLQRNLREDGYNQCKVLTVGKCGASTQDQLNWLTNTSLLEDLKPDLVLIGYVENDAEYRNEQGNRDPDYYVTGSISDKGILSLVKAVFPNASDTVDGRLREKMNRAAVSERPDLYLVPDWQKAIISGPYLQRYEETTIKPLGEYVAASGKRFCVIPMPRTPHRERFSVFYQDVPRLFSAAGIPFYECLEDFVALHGDEEEYYKSINPPNGHPGVAANAYYADFAYRMLREHYPEVLGEKHAQSKAALEVNDWYPDKVLQPEVVDGDTILFSYADDWEPDRYLYLPMFKRTVKLCFAYPTDPIAFQITDSSGTVRTDFDLYLSHLGEGGYDVMEEKPVKADGDTYPCEFSDITSMNIHRNSQSDQEERYSIRLILSK